MTICLQMTQVKVKRKVKDEQQSLWPSEKQISFCLGNIFGQISSYAEFPLETVMKEKNVQRRWFIFKENLLRIQNELPFVQKHENFWQKSCLTGQKASG